MTSNEQIPIDNFLKVLCNLGCETEVDTQENMVCVARPTNGELAVFPYSESIPIEQAFEIMKRFRVFDKFLSRVGVKTNRID